MIFVINSLIFTFLTFCWKPTNWTNIICKFVIGMVAGANIVSALLAFGWIVRGG